MTLQEFSEYLNTQSIEDKIVYMKYKYSWEDKWIYTNEILEVDMDIKGYYIWLNDWNEGQEDIEILGCISVSDIDVPEFEIRGKSTLEQEPTLDKLDEILTTDEVVSCVSQSKNDNKNHPARHRCSMCKNNDEELSAECYECVKDIADNFERIEVEE